MGTDPTTPDAAGDAVATVEAVFAAVDAPLLLFDTDGTLRRLNRRAAERYGCPTEVFPSTESADGGSGRPAGLSVPTECIQRAAAGDPQTIERRCRTATDGLCHESLSLRPLSTERSAVLATVHDRPARESDLDADRADDNADRVGPSVSVAETDSSADLVGTDSEADVDETDAATDLSADIDGAAERNARQRTKGELRRIIDLIPDNIFAKNRDGEYLLANEATADMYGLTPSDVEGKREADLLANDAEIAAFRADDRAVIESGEPRYIPEETVTTHDGETRILETTKIPYRPTDADEPAVLGYSRDVTERKRYERQLETQLENLEVLNQVVRHDIRNDLQLVSAYADILDGTLEDRAQGHLDIIKRSAENAVELTTTARDLAKTMLQTDADLRPVDLETRLGEQIERLLSARPSVSITVDGSIPSVDVVADDLLEAVFRNVLKNAVEHNDTEHPKIAIAATADADHVTLRIADNGPGVPDDRKERIFGRGEQGLESAGTGIGLYLVDTLVGRYGGSVRIEDNTPRGAVVVLTLPVAD